MCTIRKRLSWLAVFVGLGAVLPAGSAAQNGPGGGENPDVAAVHEAVGGFKAALASGDADGAMSALHAGASVFENGHAETRAQYEAGHLRGDMMFAAAVENTTTSVDVTIDGDVATYLRRYTSKGTFRDREIDATGVETIVLRRTADGWKLWHIHWSSR